MEDLVFCAVCRVLNMLNRFTVRRYGDADYLSVFSPYAGNTDQKNSEYDHFLRKMHSRAPERLFNSTPLAPLFSNFVPASDKSKETMMCAIPFLKPNSVETTLVPL